MIGRIKGEFDTNNSIFVVGDEGKEKIRNAIRNTKFTGCKGGDDISNFIEKKGYKLLCSYNGVYFVTKDND